MQSNDTPLRPPPYQ